MKNTKKSTLGILILLVLLLLNDQSCCSGSSSITTITVPPLHSTVSNNNNGAWECDEGYFRTTPSFDPDSIAVIFNTAEPIFVLKTDDNNNNNGLGLPSSLQSTCAPCTPQSVKFCPLGWQIAPCTRIMDTTCAPCPTLITSEKRYTVEGRCDIFGCSDGYYSSIQTTTKAINCLPCPKGSYCPLLVNVPQNCGPNCTTLYQGCDSPLQCIQKTNDVTSSYFVSVSYSIVSLFPLLFLGDNSNSNNNDNNILNLTSTTILYNFNSKCPLFVTSWSRPYASMQGCFLDMPSGSITCYLSIPRCVVNDILQWLMQRIDAGGGASDSTATILSNCLFIRSPPQLPLGSPLIKIDVQLPEYYYYSNHNNSNTPNNYDLVLDSTTTKKGSTSVQKMDAPALIMEPRLWGQTRGEYLFTFLLISGILMGLTLGLSAACALAYIRRSRNRVVNSNFKELSFKHHRFFLKKYSSSSSGNRNNNTNMILGKTKKPPTHPAIISSAANTTEHNKNKIKNIVNILPNTNSNNNNAIKKMAPTKQKKEPTIITAGPLLLPLLSSSHTKSKV